MGRGGNLVKYVTVICLPIAGEIFFGFVKAQDYYFWDVLSFPHRHFKRCAVHIK